MGAQCAAWPCSCRTRESRHQSRDIYAERARGLAGSAMRVVSSRASRWSSRRNDAASVMVARALSASGPSGGTATFLMRAWSPELAGLIVGKKHLVQLLTASQPDELDLDGLTRRFDEPPGNIKDPHRRAHVEHQHLAGAP